MSRSKSASFLNIYSLILIISLIGTILAGFGLSRLKTEKKNNYFKENLTSIKVAYQSSINKYKFFSSHLLEEEILDNENLKYLYKAIHSKDEKKRRYNKGIFFQKLSPLYEKFKSYGIRQLHFHLPDNRSFLRFHKPSQYNDDLTTARKSVVFVNETREPISVFETGKVASGFRNVFPIEYNGINLGTVEISVTLKSMIESLNSIYMHQKFAFIFNKDLINSKLFESQKYLYTNSLISNKFVHEDSHSVLADSPKPLSNIQLEINKELRSDTKLQKALYSAKEYSTIIKLRNKEYYNISFLPMIGLQNKMEGYLISYAKTTNLPFIIVIFKPMIIILSLIFLAITFVILKMKRQSDELIEQKNWFTTITDSLGEGLYVVNKDALIEYVNPKACEILGYKKEELFGRSAHDVFHFHEESTTVDICPILLGIKEIGSYESTSELFQHKLGHLIPIEINARGIYRGDEVFYIVIFKDISVSKALEGRMKLLTKALESSMNAVVITDKDGRVEWANIAFEKLTGFQVIEVLGKTPSELVKSGKQSTEFYQDMWNTILSKKAWNGEIINKRKNGSLYYEELSITPVLDSKKEIQNFIAIKQDISDRKEKERSIEYLAYHDCLTKLPNRRLLIEYLKQFLKSLSREHKSIALLFLDLDKFKLLNDEKGHDCGDKLLKIVATRLTKTVREEDIVARLGGDEFIILIDDLPFNKQEAQKSISNIAQNILVSIREPAKIKDFTYTPTTSIGIYTFSNHSEKIENILKKADIALYEAKAKGRNTYFMHED